MAYKVFTNGSPLKASDLNTYLMNQSVMVFANSTARSAALTSPTEGMVTYLEDTGLVYVYNGSSWIDINDNSAAIPKSTVTTAGDLIVADGNASVTRLGIGTNGQVLSISGGAPTWTTPAAGGGPSVNWSLLATINLAAAPSSAITFTGITNRKKIFVQLDNVGWTAGSSGMNWFLTVNGGNSVFGRIGLEGMNASPWVRPTNGGNSLVLSQIHNSFVNGFATILINDAELATNSEVDVTAGVQGGGTPPNGWHTIFKTILQKSASVNTISIGNTWGSQFNSGTVNLWGGV